MARLPPLAMACPVCWRQRCRRRSNGSLRNHCRKPECAPAGKHYPCLRWARKRMPMVRPPLPAAAAWGRRSWHGLRWSNGFPPHRSRKPWSSAPAGELCAAPGFVRGLPGMVRQSLPTVAAWRRWRGGGGHRNNESLPRHSRKLERGIVRVSPSRWSARNPPIGVR